MKEKLRILAAFASAWQTWMCLLVSTSAVVTALVVFKAASALSVVNVVLLSGFVVYFIWLTFRYAEWACDVVRKRLKDGEDGQG